MPHLKTVTVEVEVDISTDDLHPDDLEDLVKSANQLDENLHELIDDLYMAFKLSRHDQVPILARRLVEQHTGKIL